MANEYQISAVGLEVVHDGAAAGRLEGMGLEVIASTSTGPTLARLQTMGIEVICSLDVVMNTRRRMSLM